jgi:hypothetical protein
MERHRGSNRPEGRPGREFSFIPRIINPIKIKDVILFSADETIRRSEGILRAAMPWLRVRVLSNPLAVSQVQSDSAMVLILDDVAMNLTDVERIRQNNEHVVIVLLSFHKFVQCSPPQVAMKEYPYTAKADLVFAANRDDFAPEKIVTSVVRCAEDHLNIERRSGIRRFILLIVDDEPNWPSQFLPTLYKIIGQRADVKITRTYEDTLRFVFGVDGEEDIGEDSRERGSGDQVVCLITDIFFPKGDDLAHDAGRDLIRVMKKHYPRIPIIIASKAREVTGLAHAGFVMPKGDPGSLETLDKYIRDLTGIGDFVIFDENGRELHRLRDVREMYALLMQADADGEEAGRLRALLERYGERDMFSTWFYMHSLRELGDRLRPQRFKGRRMITVLKRSLKREILRMRYTPLVVDGVKVYTLQELAHVLRATPPERLEPLSHDDMISSWLDLQGYSELAEELRPIHGQGHELGVTVAAIVERWITIYGMRDLPSAAPPDST